MIRFSGELEGLDEALQYTAAMVRLNKVQMRTAVEFVLRELRDYARKNAPFTDRTGNLRNSIDFQMEKGGEPAGVLLAGMEYAIWVEVREGFW